MTSGREDVRPRDRDRNPGSLAPEFEIEEGRTERAVDAHATIVSEERDLDERLRLQLQPAEAILPDLAVAGAVTEDQLVLIDRGEIEELDPGFAGSELGHLDGVRALGSEGTEREASSPESEHCFVFTLRRSDVEESRSAQLVEDEEEAVHRASVGENERQRVEQAGIRVRVERYCRWSPPGKNGRSVGPSPGSRPVPK